MLARIVGWIELIYLKKTRCVWANLVSIKNFRNEWKFRSIHNVYNKHMPLPINSNFIFCKRLNWFLHFVLFTTTAYEQNWKHLCLRMTPLKIDSYSCNCALKMLLLLFFHVTRINSLSWLPHIVHSDASLFALHTHVSSSSPHHTHRTWRCVIVANHFLSAVFFFHFIHYFVHKHAEEKKVVVICSRILQRKFEWIWIHSTLLWLCYVPKGNNKVSDRVGSNS